MFEDFSDLRVSERTSGAREQVIGGQRGPRREDIEGDKRVAREEQVKVMAIRDRGSKEWDSLDNQSTLALSLDIQIISLTQELYIFL
jgi:hypothetical protein